MWHLWRGDLVYIRQWQCVADRGVQGVQTNAHKQQAYYSCCDGCNDPAHQQDGAFDIKCAFLLRAPSRHATSSYTGPSSDEKARRT